MRVELKDQFIETDDKSTEYLTNLNYSLQNEIIRIDKQLDDASLNLYQTGEAADPGWFRRAKHAKRKINLAQQAIQAELDGR